MLNIDHLMELIWPPVMERLSEAAGREVGGRDAQELLLGTAAQESGFHYLRQLGNGPALGLWQMEPRTHEDIWKSWLVAKGDLISAVLSLSVWEHVTDENAGKELAGNLYYALAMARVHYLRDPEPLPQAGDLLGQAKYWKRVWNTEMGSGTIEQYADSYRRIVKPNWQDT